MSWSLSPPSPQRWKRQGIPPFARIDSFGADGDGASVTAGHMHCFALRGARPPGLVLVREPDELGIERAHPQLAFGVRLVELAEPNRHVAADNDRTPTRLDDDHLHAACVTRRRDEPKPGKQLELAVDRHVVHARRVDHSAIV